MTARRPSVRITSPVAFLLGLVTDARFRYEYDWIFLEKRRSPRIFCRSWSTSESTRWANVFASKEKSIPMSCVAAAIHIGCPFHVLLVSQIRI